MKTQSDREAMMHEIARVLKPGGRVAHGRRHAMNSVIQLIGEMTAGQAADILAVLPAPEEQAILGLLEPAQVTKIEGFCRSMKLVC